MSGAFGAPGIDPTWTSSSKDLVTTALDGYSRVWLALGHGIGNEIYWPSTGQPQIRDVGFIVTSRGKWTEVKRASRYKLTTPEPAVLVPTIVHQGDGWSLTLVWSIDPNRDTVLIEYQLTGDADGLFVLVAPHLGAGQFKNSAWTDGDLHAVADGADIALCVTCDQGFEKTSVGYVGASDGWQDITKNNEMTWQFDTAPSGNVALTAELTRPSGTLAIGFATTPQGASVLAKSSLAAGPADVRSSFTKSWERFAVRLDSEFCSDRWQDLAQLSAAVLACHEDRTYPGATVASLSVPWGNSQNDLGGYHLVWARDCVEIAFGRLALGEYEAARRTLVWLCATQQADGHWTQNSFPDGRPFWGGVQLDEVALPILLAAALEEGEAKSSDPTVERVVQRAAQYLVTHGPTSPQDRWEENAGTNTFTLATVVAGLIAATPWMDTVDAAYALSLARYWNERIEDWLYVPGGPLCEGRDISGYYIRMGRSGEPNQERGRVDVRNREGLEMAPEQFIACDFMALVRFGLRSPSDARIVDTVALIDELLRVELPTGVAYHRYNADGYGEHADGSPFDGTGIGRPWPLLTGERGHYAAQAGEDPEQYLRAMAEMTGPGGLLPEQVWDGEPIPERFLEPGHPSGSAMPLAWAHAEFIKLATYESRDRPIEQLPIVVTQLAESADRIGSQAWHWRTDLPFTTVPAERDVIVDHPSEFTLRSDAGDLPSEPLGMGRHGVRVLDRNVLVAFAVVVDGVEIAEGSVSNR